MNNLIKLITILTLFISSGIAQAVPDVPVAVENVYPLYPALDLSQIPWHNGAGPWGPQVVLQCPDSPVTIRNVIVNTAAELTAAASISNTQITINSSWTHTTNAFVTGNDIDIVIPPGITIGAIRLGNWPYTTSMARIRVRGIVPNQPFSGGTMGQFRDYALASDIILDSINLNGGANLGQPSENATAFRVYGTRVAILNCRALAAGPIWLGHARHVVVANTNMYHGANTRAQNSFAEGWGIRNSGGPFTIVDSRLDGTRYTNIRMQSIGTQGELFYTTRSTYVALAEGRTAWLWNNLGNGPWNGQGAIIENCNIYTFSNPGCHADEINAANCGYSRVRNNTFYGGGNAVFTQARLNSRAAAGGGPPYDHDWTVGNVFYPLTTLPVWTGPGDPRLLPLPSGFPVISGEPPCTSFY